MHTSSRVLHTPMRIVVLTMLLICAAPILTQAQTTATMVAGQVRRADALSERASRLFESPVRYREAARLLRQAAELRAGDDGRATKELLIAGRLSYYAGDLSTAQRTLEDGAERALENGQLSIAANAYIDAAFSALARKDAADALAFVRRAQRLAASPHLLRAEQDEILSRIGPIRVAMAGEVH